MRYAEIPCIVTVHSVSGNTLRDAQIWGILPHIALAASGFSCFQHENASWYCSLCTVTVHILPEYCNFSCVLLYLQEYF